MDVPDTPTARDVVRSSTWTLTETMRGFDLVVHPARGRKWLVTFAYLGLVAAVVVVLIDILSARGISKIGFVGGMVGGLLPGLWRHIQRTWKHDETLSLVEKGLTHVHVGARGVQSRSTQLGDVVEIEAEPTYLADGVAPSIAPPRPCLTLHTGGRTIGIGHGLQGEDGTALLAELAHRIAPERRPVPGRPGTVRALLFPLQTGEERQRRYVGRQRQPPVGTEGAFASVLLVLSAIALVGGVIAIGRSLAIDSPGELGWTASTAGLLGLATLYPRRGLLDRWRDRLVATLDEQRAPGAPSATRRTALYRLAHTSATIGLPVIGGTVVWLGAPDTPLLLPLWLALVVLALLPMSVSLWRLAFAGTTETRVPAPLVAGERAEIKFALQHDAAPFSFIAFRLLRAELRRGPGLLRFARYWTTHEGVYHVPADTPPPGPNEEVSAVFDIPADVGSTDEESTPAIRWFLEVRGITSAGPYIEAFPVPVFDAEPQA